MAHPALSPISSTLSSAPTEASLFRDVAESLAQYLPQHENDKTRLVLETFLNFATTSMVAIGHFLEYSGSTVLGQGPRAGQAWGEE